MQLCLTNLCYFYIACLLKITIMKYLITYCTKNLWKVHKNALRYLISLCFFGLQQNSRDSLCISENLFNCVRYTIRLLFFELQIRNFLKYDIVFLISNHDSDARRSNYRTSIPLTGDVSPRCISPNSD